MAFSARLGLCIFRCGKIREIIGGGSPSGVNFDRRSWRNDLRSRNDPSRVFKSIPRSDQCHRLPRRTRGPVLARIPVADPFFPHGHMNRHRSHGGIRRRRFCANGGIFFARLHVARFRRASRNRSRRDWRNKQSGKGATERTVSSRVLMTENLGAS